MLERFEFENGPGWVHARGKCADDEACPIHHPSLHPMIEEPLGLYDPSGQTTILMYRLCRHGIRHPDPDSLAYCQQRGLDEVLGGFLDLGNKDCCDGCCRKLDTVEPKDP